MPLDREWAAYEREKPKLLSHTGQFVLIHGDGVIGVYPTVQDAHREGYRRFLAGPFLVHQISEVEPVYTVFRAKV